MKTYNISINNAYLSNNIQNVDIKDIQKLINDSVNNIFVYCLNALTEDSVRDNVAILLNKLGLNGEINITILNINKYIRDFIDGKIDKNNFIETMHKLQTVVMVDDIVSSLDPTKHRVQQIFEQNYQTSLIIRKISL